MKSSRLSYFALGTFGTLALAIPLLAHAGVFSFVSNILPHADAETFSASATNAQAQTTLSSSGNGTIETEDGALLADNNPAGGISENQDNSPISDKISVYTVQDGDTLSSIAQSFHVSVNTIRWNNDIQGSTIRPGQKLTILPISGIRHTVQSGDTLSSIAQTYKANISDIETYNDITSSTVLHAGDVVIVPNGEMTTNSDNSIQSPSSDSSGSSSTSNDSGSTPSVPPSPRSAENSFSRVRIGGPMLDLPSDYFIRPVPGPLTQGLHGYNAVDLGDPKGTPIKAAADGKVIVSITGGWNGGYGTYVVIEHPNGVETLYAHMSKNVAVENSEVTQGEIIGYVGATGEATGPHLHFEVRGAKNPFAN